MQLCCHPARKCVEDLVPLIFDIVSKSIFTLRLHCSLSPFRDLTGHTYIKLYMWHRFILPLPPTFRMVKDNIFEVTQNKFYELILLLKVYMPSNKRESVLFLTKNERDDLGEIQFLSTQISNSKQKIPLRLF